MFELDPNWFYSSLAQSAAAIVGLLGGIFATRLQTQITDSREQRLKSIQALQRLHERLTKLRTPLHEYLDHTDSQLALLHEQLRAGITRIDQPVWYAHVEKSLNASVEVSDRMIRIEQDRTRDAKLLLPLVAAALDTNSMGAVHALDRGLGIAIDQLSEQTRHLANALYELGRSATRELSILLLRCNTRPSWMLWWCLAALTTFGVVAPLWFLSAHAVAHKVGLLGAFVTTLIVLLTYLGSQIKELSRSGQFYSVLPPDEPELVSKVTS